MQITTWLTNFLCHSGLVTRARARRRVTYSPIPECLESRQVPAAVVALSPMSPVLNNGVLTVIGNDSSNTIDVTKSGTSISVLGKSFASSSVSTIVIDGAGGDDIIKVSEAITQKTCLYGGPGADVIFGGGGNDLVYGGSGADTIRTRAGNDRIFGGTGQDTVDGGTGSNSMNDLASGDVVTNADSDIGEDPTLIAYAKNTFTGQVVNEVLRLVNYERGKAGQYSVTSSANLNFVASDYVQTLDRLDVTVAQGLNRPLSGHAKPLLGSRLAANQVSAAFAGENNIFTAEGRGLTSTQLASVFMYGSNGKGGLMGSSTQRATLLGSSFNKIGLGVSGTNESGYYLTQVFTS